jgi:hypothetical protein
MRLLTLAVLAGAAAAGCASTTASLNPPQSARYGISITWNTDAAANTVSGETALAQQCGLPAPYRAVAASNGGVGSAESYYQLASHLFTAQLGTCLTASPLVTTVNILGGPLGSGH